MVNFSWEDMKMNDFYALINEMIAYKNTGDNELLEVCLNGLKYAFDEDAVTDIEDYVFGLNDRLCNMSLKELYNHIYTC